MDTLWSYLLITVCLLYGLGADESSKDTSAQCKRPTIENMDRLSEDQEYYDRYDSVDVWCKPGYDPDSFTMTCMKPQTSNEWMNTGTCKAQCKKPTIKNVGRLLPGQKYYNAKEVLTILCKPGYSASSDTMRCANPGTPEEWTPPTVTCKARCKRPVLEHLLNPYPYKMSYDEGEEVRVDCKSRHYPSYDTTRCVHPLTPQEWIPAVTCIGMTAMERVTSTSVSAWMSCTPECPHHWRLEVELCDVLYGLCKTLATKDNGTFTDLRPSSDYSISFTLHNNQAQYKMVPRLIRTETPVPGQFDIVKFPTMQDSTIIWTMPYKWGNITGFNVTVSARRDYDQSFGVDDSIWFPSSVTAYQIPLQYGTKYTITLRAFTSAGPERIREWITETDIGDPPLHPKDTLREKTLQLYPVPAENGPISSYDVIVYSGHGRNLSMDCLGFINTPYNSSLALSGYTAAVLPAETLTGPQTFILGDNRHYNGFHNVPLISNINYMVYIRVTSCWKRVKKSSCAIAGVI